MFLRAGDFRKIVNLIFIIKNRNNFLGRFYQTLYTERKDARA